MEVRMVTFGKRKITRVNYSNGIFLPKIMLENMGVGAGDYLEFFADNDGTYRIKPIKGKRDEIKQQETSQKINAETPVQ